MRAVSKFCVANIAFKRPQILMNSFYVNIKECIGYKFCLANVTFKRLDMFMYLADVNFEMALQLKSS